VSIARICSRAACHRPAVSTLTYVYAEALANAVRDAARPIPTATREPAPGAPVEVIRRGHLRMLQDPGSTAADNTEQA
jgi:hypothetical protein